MTESTAQSPARPAGARSPMVPRPPAPRSRRRPTWVAAGVLAICLGALGAALLFTQVAESHAVVLVSANVARGEAIEAGDLTTVSIGSSPGVSTVPSERLDELIGRHALVDLVAGSLLPAGAIGDQALPPGSVQLGLRLSAGRLPLEALPPGTPIELVAVAGQGAATDSLTGTVIAGVLLSAPVRSDDGQARLLDVRVDKASAVTVARLAAADRLVLIRLPEH